MTPEDFVAAVSDPFQNLGAMHYFGPKAKAAAEGLGIDGFRFYFAGRGGVLGAVSPEVLSAAFGYFNPETINKIWPSCIERCDVTAAAQAQLGVAYDIGDEFLGGIDGLAEAAASLGTLMTSIDLAALPLFAGFVAQPVPAPPTHAFMHQTIMFRELRGSVHLAAVAAAGCRSRAAHQIRRPNDLEMFGYDDAIEISDTERAAYEMVEERTDAAMAVHAAAGLSADQRSQIAATVETITATMSSVFG